MKARVVNVRVSTGRVLCGTVFRADGKKLLAKGHLIREDDISILESEGMVKVWVTELEDEEIDSQIPGHHPCSQVVHQRQAGRFRVSHWRSWHAPHARLVFDSRLARRKSRRMASALIRKRSQTPSKRNTHMA